MKDFIWQFCYQGQSNVTMTLKKRIDIPALLSFRVHHAEHSRIHCSAKQYVHDLIIFCSSSSFLIHLISFAVIHGQKLARWLPRTRPLLKVAMRPYATATGTVTVHKSRWTTMKRILQFGVVGGIGYSGYGKCMNAHVPTAKVLLSVKQLMVRS